MNTRFRATDNVLFEELNGEAVLLNLATGRYYGLNAVGTRIWELLKAGHDAPAITRELVRTHEVSPEQAAGDVDRLLHELQTHRLIEPITDAPTPHTPQS